MSKEKRKGYRSPWERKSDEQKQKYNTHIESFSDWTVQNADILQNSAQIADLEHILKIRGQVELCYKIVGILTIPVLITFIASIFQSAQGVEISPLLSDASLAIFLLMPFIAVPIGLAEAWKEKKLRKNVMALSEDLDPEDNLFQKEYIESLQEEYFIQIFKTIYETYIGLQNLADQPENEQVFEVEEEITLFPALDDNQLQVRK